MGEADFNQFLRLRNHPIFAAENFSRLENFSPLRFPTRSKDSDEFIKMAHEVGDAIKRPNRNFCVTLLRCKNGEARVFRNSTSTIFKKEGGRKSESVDVI